MNEPRPEEIRAQRIGEVLAMCFLMYANEQTDGQRDILIAIIGDQLTAIMRGDANNQLQYTVLLLLLCSCGSVAYQQVARRLRARRR